MPVIVQKKLALHILCLSKTLAIILTRDTLRNPRFQGQAFKYYKNRMKGWIFITPA